MQKILHRAPFLDAAVAHARKIIADIIADEYQLSVERLNLIVTIDDADLMRLADVESVFQTVERRVAIGEIRNERSFR